MSIRVTCKDCTRSSELRDDCAGRQVPCEFCGTVIFVPGLPPATARTLDPNTVDARIWQAFTSGKTPQAAAAMRVSGTISFGGKWTVRCPSRHAIVAARLCVFLAAILLVLVATAGFFAFTSYNLAGELSDDMRRAIIMLAILFLFALFYLSCARRIRGGSRIWLGVALVLAGLHLAAQARDTAALLAQSHSANFEGLGFDPALAGLNNIGHAGAVAVGCLLVLLLFGLVFNSIQGLRKTDAS